MHYKIFSKIKNKVVKYSIAIFKLIVSLTAMLSFTIFIQPFILGYYIIKEWRKVYFGKK